MTAKSTSKSAARVELGRAAIAKAARDPATGRLVKRQPETPPGGSLADQTGIDPAGGGAPAPTPFRGFRARLRHRSGS